MAFNAFGMENPLASKPNTLSAVGDWTKVNVLTAPIGAVPTNAITALGAMTSAEAPLVFSEINTPGMILFFEREKIYFD